jgi:hypothetical protein
MGITGEPCVQPVIPFGFMDAPPRPAAPLDDSAYTLTVAEAADRYAAAGFPRPIRRLQKYCARGDLECRKVETSAFGEHYLITAESIDRHIAYIRETADAAGRAPACPGAPEPTEDASQILQTAVDAPLDASARPGASDVSFQVRYLEHLEKENAFLRDQNTVLLERVKETNILTGRLQEMLTPLLGRSSETRGDETIVPNDPSS